MEEGCKLCCLFETIIKQRTGNVYALIASIEIVDLMWPDAQINHIGMSSGGVLKQKHHKRWGYIYKICIIEMVRIYLDQIEQMVRL